MTGLDGLEDDFGVVPEDSDDDEDSDSDSNSSIIFVGMLCLTTILLLWFYLYHITTFIIYI